MSDTILLVSSALGAVVLIVVLIIHLSKNKKKVVKSKTTSKTIPPPMSLNNSINNNVSTSNNVNTNNNIGNIKSLQNALNPEIIQEISKDAATNISNSKKEKKSYQEFIRVFPSFNLNPKLIKDYLLELDYSEIDKGQLKTLLEHNGISFNGVNEIIDAIQTKYIQKQNTSIIEDSISHYKNLGWSDEKIKEHFHGEGYSHDILNEAFKEYYKKNIYNKYVQNIVNHMKPFIKSGKDDSFIINIFLDHKWPRELIEDALNKAQNELKDEESTKFLEESILKIILKGNNKDCFAKIIAKKDWPEEDLRKQFNDIKQGYTEFENSLKKLDLNEYNKEKIKDSLITKNWPEKLVNKILLNLIEKVEYHRKLINLEYKIYDQIESGFFSSENVTSQKVKDELIADGWNGTVIKRLKDKINRDLLINGEKEKMKEFNSHVFKKQKYKELSDVISGFEVSSVSELNQKNNQYLKPSKNSN